MSGDARPGKRHHSVWLVAGLVAAFAAVSDAWSQNPTSVAQIIEDGNYKAERGYTGQKAYADPSNCPPKVGFSVHIKSGVLTFDGQERDYIRHWRGTINQHNGRISIRGFDAIPPTKSPLSIVGPYNNARVESDFCGLGYFIIYREPLQPVPPAADQSSSPVDCLSPMDIEKHFGEFRRNREALSSPALCLKQDIFTEGQLRWKLQIIENKKYPTPFLWFVPHEDEQTAFNGAVYGVTKYGGIVVGVEGYGARSDMNQDPNRNFDTGSAIKCPEQVARSPEYTRRVLAWRPALAPIIALHTNKRGYSGDGKSGSGTISMAKPLPANTPYNAVAPLGSSPDDTLVFLASTVSRHQDANLSNFISELNRRGINVMLEHVSDQKSDCSFSNYAALKKIRDYVSVEVVDGDDEIQRRILDVVVELMKKDSFGLQQ